MVHGLAGDGKLLHENPCVQGYVRRRLLALANMPCVARSLNSPSEVICQALIQAMEMGHLERVDSEPGQPGSAEWQLVFRHECL